MEKEREGVRGREVCGQWQWCCGGEGKEGRKGRRDRKEVGTVYHHTSHGSFHPVTGLTPSELKGRCGEFAGTCNKKSVNKFIELYWQSYKDKEGM